MQHWLAGSPGPQTSPDAVITVVALLVVLVGGAFTLQLLVASRRRQREAPGRTAAADAPVTASWPVQIRREGRMSVHGPGLDAGQVALRGEFIEVAHSSALGRAFHGRECYFPARQAWLLVEPAAFGRQWLVITGTSSGEPATVAVSPAGGRPALEQLWNALVTAGARPEQHQPNRPAA